MSKVNVSSFNAAELAKMTEEGKVMFPAKIKGPFAVTDMVVFQADTPRVALMSPKGDGTYLFSTMSLEELKELAEMATEAAARFPLDPAPF